MVEHRGREEGKKIFKNKDTTEETGKPSWKLDWNCDKKRKGRETLSGRERNEGRDGRSKVLCSRKGTLSSIARA